MAMRLRRARHHPKSKFWQKVDVFGFAFLITFSFVLLIPFYLAANTLGPVAVYALVAINLLGMVFGYRLLWRRWQSLTEPEIQASSIPNVDGRK